MLDHYIQKNIVYALATAESLRFSELKPDDLENKLFDYHLKKVIASGLVEKLESGEYALSPLGRRVGKDLILKSSQLIDRAHSILFLVIRRPEDGAWLLGRRKIHPLFDRIGFMDAKPQAHESILLTAHDATLEKTGLDCEFTVRGSGYLRMYDGDETESFTHFTVLECHQLSGELTQGDELADYDWYPEVDLNAEDLLPTVQLIADQLTGDALFFVEKTLRTES